MFFCIRQIFQLLAHKGFSPRYQVLFPFQFRPSFTVTIKMGNKKDPGCFPYFCGLRKTNPQAFPSLLFPNRPVSALPHQYVWYSIELRSPLFCPHAPLLGDLHEFFRGPQYHFPHPAPAKGGLSSNVRQRPVPAFPGRPPPFFWFFFFSPHVFFLSHRASPLSARGPHNNTHRLTSPTIFPLAHSTMCPPQSRVSPFFSHCFSQKTLANYYSPPFAPGMG